MVKFWHHKDKCGTLEAEPFCPFSVNPLDIYRMDSGCIAGFASCCMSQLQNGFLQVNNFIINKTNKIKNVMNATLIARIACAANNKHEVRKMRNNTIGYQ